VRNSCSQTVLHWEHGGPPVALASSTVDAELATRSDGGAPILQIFSSAE